MRDWAVVKKHCHSKTEFHCCKMTHDCTAPSFGSHFGSAATRDGRSPHSLLDHDTAAGATLEVRREWNWARGMGVGRVQEVMDLMVIAYISSYWQPFYNSGAQFCFHKCPPNPRLYGLNIGMLKIPWQDFSILLPLKATLLRTITESMSEAHLSLFPEEFPGKPNEFHLRHFSDQCAAYPSLSTITPFWGLTELYWL